MRKNLDRVAEFFGVEQRHYQKVFDVTEGLVNDFAVLSNGNNREDCMRYKIAAERLGYEVKEVNSDELGYPYNYVLRKDPSIEIDDETRADFINFQSKKAAESATRAFRGLIKLVPKDPEN